MLNGLQERHRRRRGGQLKHGLHSTMLTPRICRARGSPVGCGWGGLATRPCPLPVGRPPARYGLAQLLFF